MRCPHPAPKTSPPPNSENDEIVQATEASRVISVSFSPQTKTTLEDFQPKFAEGDSILISNGEVLDTCEVSVNGDNATISTELTGPLKAVYPYKAAQIIDTEISDEVLVSTAQDGTFANVHICMAVMKAANDKSLLFENKTAVFRITPGAGAGTKYVEVITAGPEIANTTTTEYTKKNKIHVATTVADEVFVSVLVPDGGLKLRDLSFADGSNMKTVTDATKGATEIAANTIYTINNSNWDRPYVEIEMTVNSVTRKYKWATMNIGASSETEYGDYFMWGYTVGHTADTSSTDAFAGQTFKEGERGNDTNGFAWDNYIKFTSDTYSSSTRNVFTKYVPSNKTAYWYGTDLPDNKTVLDLADDAANANWGGSWRMPTKEEFDALKDLIQGVFSSGYYFGDSDENQIFLPAAGRGNGTDLNNAGDIGNYWSSSLATGLPDCAYFLDFLADDAYTNNGGSRYYGRSVRPVSD